LTLEFDGPEFDERACANGIERASLRCSIVARKIPLVVAILKPRGGIRARPAKKTLDASARRRINYYEFRYLVDRTIEKCGQAQTHAV